MKICMVAPYAEPEKGAAIVRVNSFSIYFQSEGHAVTVIAPSRAGLKSKGNVIRYKSITHLMSLLLKADFDVLIAVSPPIAPAFFSLIVCKLKMRPFVLDSKDIFTYTATRLGLLKEGSIKFHIYKFMESVAHKSAARILVLDNQIGDLLSKIHSIARDKISLAANGVDTKVVRQDKAEGEKLREKLKVPKNSALIIYLGGLGDEKYIQFLEENSATIKRYNAHVLFVIASDETASSKGQIAEIYSTVAKFGIKNNFHLLKNIEYKDVYKYLSAADIGLEFLADLKHFAVTVKVLEYMACGLPVIAKMPEGNKIFQAFFKKHDIGYASTAWRDFRKHLVYALGHLKNFKRKGHKGENIIKNEFTRDATSRKVLAILNELSGSGN